MKFFYALFITALIAIPTLTKSAIIIDGVADAAYGSAISTQAIGTTAFDNNISTNTGLANGSELDAAYGFVSNGVLFLTIAGNFDSEFGVAPYDTLHMFFMTDDGGTANVVPTFADCGFAARRCNMAGMIFDTGFNPNYWIYVNSGQNDSNTTPVTTFADYVVFSSNGTSAFLGNVNPPGTITNIYFGSIVQVSVDNSNTNGVDANPCDTNATTLAAQSVAASAVRSGAELAIPLTQLGLLSSATGTIRVCAFITDVNMQYIYNQSLGAFNGGAGYCLNYAGQNFVSTSGFDFNSYPGQHYFTIPVPPCDVIKINPASADYTSTGGVGSVTLQNSGGCAITVTASTNWLSVTGSSGLGSGNGSFSYSVAPNTNSIQTRTGQFIIRNTEPSGNIVTQLMTITETGVPSPRLSTIFDIDGIAEAAYGCPIVVQQIGTGFGDTAHTNLFDGSSTGGGNSELDAAYGMIQNDVLFLTLAGNLEFNNNGIHIFIMTGPGGVSTLSTNNNQTAVGNNAVHALAVQGITFDGGFAPNYWIGVNGDHSPRLFFDYAELWPGGTNNPTGLATNGFFLGSTTTTNGTLVGGRNLGIQGTFNNTNTNGVDGNSCPTNTTSGMLQSIGAATVTTGLELGIPLAAIGSPTGAIYICAFISGGGNHTYLSNQFLPAIGSDTNCQSNLTNTNNLNLAIFPGGPHYFAVGPQMRVTGINRSGTAINVNYLTAANTNLTYQLQRTSAITNTTWLNVGGLQIGTGGILTGTDSFGATNSARFYRVRQTPLCP